jgi:hypothetical protein
MKVFVCNKAGLTAVAVAYNRGHACKLLAKELESRSLTFSKDDPVVELNLDEPQKGSVSIFPREIPKA